MIKKTLVFALLLISTMLQSQIKQKIDGVAVVVGENIVLNSDIAKFKLEVEQKSEGKISMSDCQMLEEIMLQKLLAHHGVVDSIPVDDLQVKSRVDGNIKYFVQQLGSMEKVVDLYGFEDEDDLRREMLKIERESTLVRGEKEKILEKVEVTPEEVRLYFKSLEKEGNLPEFGTEIELAQIVIHVEPTEQEIVQTIEKLKKIRNDVINGSSLRMKAVLYSEDPGVTQNGGLYTLNRESGFVKEFKEAAFSLDEGEISEPFKSDFGYNILQVEKIKGQEVDARHLLLQPKVSEEKLKLVEKKLNAVRDSILTGKITFEDAVKKYSDDKDTKQNKGLIMNPQSNDSHFELTRMDPSLYSRVSSLKQDEICKPYFDETREGEKMYKIILMKSKVEGHKADFVQDYVKIQQLTLQKKEDEVLEKWYKKHILDTYIKLGDEHKTCENKYNWAKK